MSKMDVNDHHNDVPENGAVFTFGKCKFNGNKPGKFWLKDEAVKDVSCGDEHTVLISENGKLYTFGDNSWGQLGLGHTEPVDRPTRVKKFDPIASVACGKSHTIVLTDIGSIYGFGCNIDGQSNPSDINSTKVLDPVEVELPEEQNVKMLSAGADHSAALTVSGRVYVWGSCGYLHLDSQMPSLLPLKETIKQISCGYYHTVVLTEHDTVLCYGETEGGKLGVGPTEEEYLEPTVVGSIGDNEVVRVAAGHSHTFIITGSGRALSCGDGFQGQLGQGTMVMSRDVPELVPLEQKILRVSCGESHTAVITNDRKLFLCGDGRHGKLCLDNLSNYFTFSSPKVFANVDVMKVACGGCHTIVLVKPKSGLPMVEDGEEVRGKSSPEKIDIVDIDEQQEFNTDSLARSRRRNKKQDKQTLLNRKELKVNLSFKSNRTIETNESPKKDEIRTTPENVNMAADDDDAIEDFDQKDGTTTLEEDAENDDVSINELQHEYEAIKTEAGRNENSVTVVDGLNKNKTKKRSSRRTKAKLRSQPEAEDKPVDEADTNNNESEENKQSTNSKRRRNSKKHNKLRSRKNSAPKAPEMAAQSSEEIKKVEKRL